MVASTKAQPQAAQATPLTPMLSHTWWVRKVFTTHLAWHGILAFACACVDYESALRVSDNSARWKGTPALPYVTYLTSNNDNFLHNCLCMSFYS